MLRALIIDDEESGWEVLTELILLKHPEISLLPAAETVADAVTSIDKYKPELVFLDIKMPGESGFDLLRQIQPITFDVIFTTAFDEYAIAAIRCGALDYLLKPINPEDLLKAVQKYQARQTANTGTFNQQIQSVFGQLNRQKKHRCLVKRGNHFEFIEVSDIAFVHSESSITFLHTFDGKRHLYNNTIEGLVKGLDETLFFQISRHQIVNVNAVQKIHPYFNQRLKLELNTPAESIEFLVSRSKITSFKNWIDL